MVRRREGAAFMAGAYVFPGGRVEAGDRNVDERWSEGIQAAAVRMADLDAGQAAAFHVAAARELFEEAGVLLARDRRGEFVSLAGSAHQRFKQYRREVHGGAMTLSAMLAREELRLALDVLVPFAHWVTPPVDARRFDTRFFVARVPQHQSPAHDETETTESAWLSPAAAIALCRRGDIILPPPTWTTLRELEPFASVDAALAWARARRIQRREPKFVEQNGARMLLLPGDPLNPEPSLEPPPAETRFILSGGRWRAEAVRT
jgi:8-oxo-dGTP pyrophosphatase MutT (NUDIX family)